MFSSTKIGDSPSPLNKRKTQLQYSPRPNDFRPISKKSLSFRLTSTPPIMNNRRSNSFSSTSRLKRYSLSDIVSTTPKYLSNIDTIKSKSVQKTCGPLLASTQYNINLSTYVDSKSPGFAGRIVQYNEERERLKTHQSRYGSPGLFPIVHLSKKDLPIISPKSKRVTIRIASPDCSRYASPDSSRILFAGSSGTGNTSQDNSSKATNQQLNDISTRSVLDALKEISRKRIHPGEEYEVSEDAAKRYRSDNFNGMDNQKRIFDEQTTLENNNAQASKKICVVDSYYASVSSYMKKPLDLNETETKEQGTQKTTVEPEKKTVATVETQTVPEENPAPLTDSKTTSDEVEEDKNEKKSETEQSPAADCPKKQHRKAPLRIFDEKPLEILRKNRLAALLGALTGEEPVLLEKEDKLAKFREESEREEELEKERLESEKPNASPRKSILVQDNKKSEHLEKHVTFALPDGSSESRPTDYSPLPCFPLITQTSASITTPLMSASLSGSPKSSMTGADSSMPVAVSAMTTSASLNFRSDNESMRSNTTTRSGGDGAGAGSSFFAAIPGSNSNQVDKPVVSSSEMNVTTANPGSSFESAFKPVSDGKFQFGFGSQGAGNATSNPINNNEASIGTSTAKAQISDNSTVKSGGFKFDLPLSSAGASEKAEPAPSPEMMQESPKPKQTNFSYNSSPDDRIAFGRGSQNLVSSTTMTNPTMSFGHWNSISGSNQTPTSPRTVSVHSDSNTNKPFAFGQSGSFNSPVKTSESGFSVNPPTFGSSMVESGNKVPVFGGMANATPSAAGAQNKLDFGVVPVTVNSVTGTNTGNDTTPFGANNPGAATTNTLGTNAPMFNFASTSNFNNTTVTSTFSFGNAAVPVSVPVPSFGTSTNNSAAFQAAQPNSTPFGVSSMPPGFGAQTTTSSNPVFGNPSLSFPFANNPVSSTNAGTSASGNPNGAANMFGAATTTAPSFGSSKPSFSFSSNSGGGFGANATTQPSGLTGVSGTTGATTFGAAAGANAGGFSFGSNNAPNSASPGFASTQSSTFGSTNNMFGNISKPMFGATAATTTSTNIPSFGSAATPSFSFGGSAVTTASSAAPNIFGSSTPAFGTATTTSSNVFGGTNTFVSQSGFGGGSAFKPLNANPVFGSNAAPAFPTTTTSAFQSTNVPSFGSSTSGFGTSTSTANNAPGGSTSAFSTPNFASPAPVSSPFAVNSNALGAGGSGGVSSTSGFNSSGNSGFSAKAPAPSFGSFTSPQNNAFGSAVSGGSGFSAAAPTSNGGFSFGPNTQATGGFSFGSPEPPKAGFNFSSNAASPPSFSGSFSGVAPPAFGATIPTFNAPPMFSIGSGSAPAKSRTQAKGRRRTDK